MYATFHQVCSDVGVIWVVQQYYTLKVFETFYRPDKSFFSIVSCQPKTLYPTQRMMIIVLE